jgi:hypothetical protein
VTVLALEFRGVRENADFGFLDGVTRVDPIAGHTAGPLTVRRQAEQLASTAVDLVLAYCSCAAVGAHVAALSGARLVLIDPDVVTHAAVRRDFEHLCASLGANPGGSWEDAFASVRDDLAAVHGSDEEAYEMVDDIIDRYLAWLRFLDASVRAPVAELSGEVEVIAGRPLPDLGKLLGDPGRAAVTTVVPRAGTLGSAEVRQRLAREVGRLQRS